MARFEKRHYSETCGCMIGDYWTPENTDQVMPCETKEEAESLEQDIEDAFLIG